MTAEERVFMFNGHGLFTYDDAYHQEKDHNVVEYHGCRLLCNFRTPPPQQLSRHDEQACQRNCELGVIECDASGNLRGYDDTNHLRLDYSRETLLCVFPIKK